ncbi:MAG: precorrin-6y C5,15-methyltransferase (decarboxylating) subunit CbiE, partial [Rhodocyclaceae bacterium]
MNRVAIIGILDDGWDGLGDAARSRLGSADCVIGAARHLECVRPYLAAACELHALDGALGKVPEWVEAAVAAGKSVAVLATGDPLLHGLASHLLGKLGVAGFDILPAPSTLQLAFARWKKAWQDVAIASCHGKDAGEWFVGATPEHSLYPVLLAIANHRRVFVFLSPANDPSRLARALLTAGFAQVKLSVAERLLTPDETV